MDTRTLQDLGFPTILAELKTLSLAEEGRQTLASLEFITDWTLLSQRQEIVEDLLDLESYGVQKPISFPSLKATLNDLHIPGKNLDGEQLFTLASYLEAGRIFTEYCRSPRKLPTEADRETPATPAMALFQPFNPALQQLYDHITFALESPGQVKSSHPSIAKLSREVERRRLERQLFSTDFLKTQVASEHVQPAFRDGRVVLPIRTDQRAKLEGVIHSSSATGVTIYMEPYRLVELNNQVIMAQQQIQIEIARILADLSQEARLQLEAIEDLQQQVGFADSMYARSRYVAKHACVRPLASNDGSLLLKQGRHPLLGKKAVPITIELDATIKAVVISGPNAGGKTVTIKTIGLFALLHQFLYFVPGAEGTQMPLFQDVYTDVGDEQSIEESLSTFSAHMRNIGRILRSCNQHSLIILDELGSGTDPVEGSALARAILEYCVERAALTLITSHHGVLKQFAYAHEHLLNASMEFNAETHEPTFKVISGLPGDSHALETAKRMDLPQSVLQAATTYIGAEMVEISTIIAALEEKRREVQEREQQLEERMRKLQEQIRKIDLRQLKLAQDEQLVRKQQLGDLSKFISDKRSELENLIAELREGEISRAKTRKSKAFIASLEKKQKESEQKIEALEEEVGEEATTTDFAVGMDVLAGPHRREGRIVRQEKEHKWVVAIGPMKFTLHERELKPIPSRLQKERKKVLISYESRTVAPQPIIDVRGMTLEQSLEVVSEQIEGALVHSIGSFSIIHGLGDGILSRGIHDYLEKVPQVNNYYFARPEDGGYGKTYVEF